MYHWLSLPDSSSACNNSVSDHVGDFGEVSLLGLGGSEGDINVVGFGRMSILNHIL